MEDELNTIVDLLTKLPNDIASAIEKCDTDISEKLDIIIALLNEQKIQLEKYYEENVRFGSYKCYEKIIDIPFEEIKKSKLTFLLGYRRKDIESYFNTLSVDRELSWHQITSVETPGDLMAVLTSSSDNNFLVFDSRAIKWNREIQEIIHQAAINDTFDMLIGKGSSAKKIKIDFPVCNYVFYDSSDLYLPNRVKEDFDCCFCPKKRNERLYEELYLC